MIDGILLRRTMRNAQAASILRRSLTVTPRLLVALFPVLALLFAPAILAIVVFDLWMVPGILVLALITYGIVIAPVIAGVVARSAIRKSFRDRMSAGAMLADAFASLPRSILWGLLLGIIRLIGTVLLYVPGLVLTAFLFPTAPAAVIERSSNPIGRASKLTVGAILPLMGVVFTIETVAAFLLRCADLLSPGFFDHRNEASSPTFVAVCVFITLFISLWQGVAMAIAYDELRVRLEDLEVDGVLVAIGGTSSIGPDYGEAISSRRMAAGRRRQRLLAIGLFIVAPIAIVAFFGVRYFLDKREKERQEQERMDRYDAERKESQRNSERLHGSADPLGRNAPGSLSAPPAEPRLTEEELAQQLDAAPDAQTRREIIRKQVAPRVSELFVSALQPPMRQVGKVPDEKAELAILPGLGEDLSVYKCVAAMQAARDAQPANASVVFAQGCKSPIETGRLKGVPLWAGALAILVNLDAKAAKKTDSPLLKALTDALLKEKL